MSKKDKLVITNICNVLEWVDYALYGGFVFVISNRFFPPDDIYTNTMYAYMIFALGFLARPVGGAVFGHIADKVDRQKSLFYSVCLMVIPTVMIGLLPGYSVLGMWAPAALLVCRIAQGLAIGGEYTGAMVHLVENAPTNRRGFAGSFVEVGCLAGTLIGGEIFVVVIHAIFGHSGCLEFAWRIPFLASVFILPLAFAVKRGVRVDVAKTSRASDEGYIPIFDLLKRHKKTCFYVALSSAFSGVNFYTILVFIPNYLVSSCGWSANEAFGSSALINMVMIVSVVVGGLLSDKFRRKNVIIPSMFCIMLLEYPMLHMIGTLGGLVYQLFSGIALSMYFGGRAAFFSEAFPKKLRCTALSVCINVSHAIFAGSTSILATYITKNFGHPEYFAFYLIAVSCVAIFGITQIKDRTGEPLE